MDLYEALKSGTSAAELEKKFREELDAAQTRIEEEEQDKAAAETYLADCRTDLAATLLDYIDALFFYFGIDDEEDASEDGEDEAAANDLVSPEDIEQVLLEFEKEIEDFLNSDRLIDKTAKSEANEKAPNIKITTCTLKSDDDIIRAFLKCLK